MVFFLSGGKSKKYLRREVSRSIIASFFFRESISLVLSVLAVLIIFVSVLRRLVTSLSFPGELPLECASEAKLVDPRAALGTVALDNGARLEGAPKDVDPGILSFAY